MIALLITLALIFGELSFLSFGGGMSILPEMQRQLVDVHHWMTSSEFNALFALAQAAPGPNLMVVTLFGWRIAGLPGALTTTVALFLPSSIITALTMRIWDRFNHTTWVSAIQKGVIPMTAGLLAASALLIVKAAVISLPTALIMIGVAVAALSSRVHPLWLLGAGALIGIVVGS